MNTYIVAHPKLFLTVQGQLQKMKLGAELRLDDAVAEPLLKRKRIVKKEDADTVTIEAPRRKGAKQTAALTKALNKDLDENKKLKAKK